jgi:hypothetical protein
MRETIVTEDVVRGRLVLGLLRVVILGSKLKLVMDLGSRVGRNPEKSRCGPCRLLNAVYKS